MVEKLGHPSYSNLKYFGHARVINIKKIKIGNNILICKIYLKTKEKHWLLYKIQHFLKDICKELHINLMDPITSIRWNKYKYFLTITDGYSRCQ